MVAGRVPTVSPKNTGSLLTNAPKRTVRSGLSPVNRRLSSSNAATPPKLWSGHARDRRRCFLARF